MSIVCDVHSMKIVNQSKSMFMIILLHGMSIRRIFSASLDNVHPA